MGIFLFTTVSRLTLGRTQPPIQWYGGLFSRGVKRPELEGDHSPPSSAEVKNAWSYTSTSQYVFMAWFLVKLRDSFNFVTPTDTTRCVMTLDMTEANCDGHCRLAYRGHCFISFLHTDTCRSMRLWQNSWHYRILNLVRSFQLQSQFAAFKVA
jgi:hypothetical protein